MRVLVRTAVGDRVHHLGLGPGATVADLCTRLQPEGDGWGLAVDGTWFDPSTSLWTIPIREGSLLEPLAEPVRTRPPTARMLAIIGGLRAGVRHPLPATGHVDIGRASGNDLAIDDPSVSARHARLLMGPTPAIVDLGSRNGTTVDDRVISGPTTVPAGAVIGIGASRLSWRIEPDDRPYRHEEASSTTPATVFALHRPPRPAPVDPAPIPLPAEPDPIGPVEPLSWAGVVLPLVAGGVVALVWSPYFALFAALGPVLSVGTWCERRRRARRGHRQRVATHDNELARTERELPDAWRAETDRRRAAQPDPAELARRASLPSVRCWERRATDRDYLRLAVGSGRRRWSPSPVDESAVPSAAAAGLLARQPMLEEVPFVVALSAGSVLGVLGEIADARDVARCLVVQAAVLHGPADLAIAVLDSTPSGEREWEWARWLPHTTDSAGRAGQLVLARGMRLLEQIDRDSSDRAWLLLVDDRDGGPEEAVIGRRLLAHPRVAGVCLVADHRQLPAGCGIVVDIEHRAGRARLVETARGRASDPFVAWGMTSDRANEPARRLARLRDPASGDGQVPLPESVHLLDLHLDGLDVDSIRRRWDRSRRRTAVAAPIGATESGPLLLDLDVDGPHMLVGGTTGSGKSELLRTLVAGLALAGDPTTVAFVLVDYKGGAAFDACTDLPHVTGVVTDLDEHLAGRALRCLEAEIRRREDLLRRAGAENLRDYWNTTDGAATPLPRLVVVVDEFASLASDLPDFLDALVSVAQRGRSLGLHLVLATQRPAGVVSEDLRANTACRIALRVTDRRDSIDVIDAPDAAHIPRTRPGRAMARLGPGEIVAFQAALVTGCGVREPVTVDPVDDDVSVSGPDQAGPCGRSDLDRIVELLAQAAVDSGVELPASPWPDPLPGRVALESLVERAASGPAQWLRDDPDGQRQQVDGWGPSEGNLVVVGGPASGKTTTLATVVVDLARQWRPDEMSVVGVDLDAGRLGDLSTLPHAGTITGPADGERRSRLLRRVDAIVGRRRQDQTDHPIILLVVDGLGGLARAHDPVRDSDLFEALNRIWLDGPGVGVVTAASIDRPGDLRPELMTAAGRVLVHRSTDPMDAARLGVRLPVADLVAGRAVDSAGFEVQVAIADGADPTAVARERSWPAPRLARIDIGALETCLPASGLPVRGSVDGRRIRLDIARDHEHLRPVGPGLHLGDRAVVVGPPRSGRTNVLALLVAALGRPRVVVVGERGTDLADRVGLDPVLPRQLPDLLVDAGPVVLVIDDAARVADPTGALESVVTQVPDHVAVVAAVTPDGLRAAFGNWVTSLRGSRCGVLLRPGPVDGDLLGVVVPSHPELATVPGRGLVVDDGVASLAQLALHPATQLRPDQTDSSASASSIPRWTVG